MTIPTVTPQRPDPTWPHQVRLPGQTHVAEGPVDLTATYLLHHALRRDLAAFQAAVATTPVADRDAWRALAVRWGRFSVSLHGHPRAEDDRVRPALEACGAAVRRLADVADDDVRRALAVRLAGLRQALGLLLREEETEVLPLQQQRSVTGPEALRLGPLQRLPWLLHGVPPEVRADVFARPGGRRLQLAWWLTRRRFEARERCTFPRAG